MSVRFEALDEINNSGQAAFAIDRTDRIIYWNSRCETLLGHKAENVLGKRCFDVMAGRDVHGNMHCYANCPVMHQTRVRPNEPLCEFTLTVNSAEGDPKSIAVGTVVIPASRSSLGAIVHVLRESPQQAAILEKKLSDATGAQPVEAKAPLLTAEGRISELTRREREILQCIARGMPTAGIADELAISPITVRNHVQNILEKLDVHTKFAAVAFAYQNGLVS